MVRINWTHISLSDLKSIFEYISEDSLRYAQITVSKIQFRVSSLKSQPLTGRIVPEINDPRIRELITGNYRIVYEIIDNKEINILRIYHSTRLLRKESLK